MLVQPLPPVRKPISLKTAVKAISLLCTFTGSGLLGYKLFVSLPSYNGPIRDLQSKPIIITEPCAKTSRELVYNLAKQGAHLILANNDWDKCDELRERLIRKYGVKSDMLECRRLEMNSLTSIRRFVAGVLVDFPLLNSAIIQSPSCVTSIISGKQRFTPDGFEQELGVNYFSAYLLSRLLIGRLNENQGRLILVIDTKNANLYQTSQITNNNDDEQLKSTKITIPLNNINWENKNEYTPEKAYQRAQWFLLMFADELARRNSSIQGKKASILVVDPHITRGLSPEKDEQYSNANGLWKLMYMLIDICPRLISRKASTTSLFCTTADSSSMNNSTVVDDNSNNHHQPNSIVNNAPIYQDLRLFVPSKPVNEMTDDRREALELLWRLSEKWTRLDTHPYALPLPSRHLIKKDKKVTSDKVETVPLTQT
ncbi:unnamed protein product [Schistosoma turkestanicum]|nr:unnamed protein product [Schistosoma turkestanicum]